MPRTRSFLLMTMVAMALAAPGCWFADALKPPPEVTQEYEAAKQLFMEEQYARAGVGFKAFVHKYPDNPLSPWAQYYLAQAYRHQEMYEPAAELFEQFLSGWPDTNILPMARYDLAQCYVGTGRLDDARSEYEKVMDLGASTQSKSAAMFAGRARERLAELE